jgi:hypothetical protein
MKINITKTQRAKLVKDWLNDMFSGAEIKNTYYGNSHYVKNGGTIAFQNKKNKVFWFDYDEIWLFLESVFSLEYRELQAITEDWVDETLNFRGYTTMFYEEDGEKERWMEH